MRVPAICNTCGTIFPSSIEVNNSRDISFSGVGSGPCPACGQMGHIPDGVYNFIGNTIELLSGPGRTIKELKRLAEIINNAKEKKLSRNEITAEIEKSLPELSSIKDVLPKTRNELYAFLAIIISCIALITSQFMSKEPQKVETNNVINNIYNQAPAQKNKDDSSSIPQKKRKIGRNDKCPCGSGKKHKKCCLI